ncbi:calmin isoform X2 [Pseudophryne corroboree]|uniref:calmin isoform X2 n=1 Tax=Pseudophryne corroboree TaxID=495146 RepID=UPI0030819251
MAGHEWDWFQLEELIGQISDIRVQNLQVERENVQKRTFTRWINLHLEKCSPPMEVKDLFVDIQDGKMLMALLEVLTGQNLLHEYKSSTHRIFRLNNIAKALKFLEDSNVKLVSIDAAEIADGNPSLVLGLIWNIILFLQIKELTGNLNRMSSSSSLSSLPSGSESDTSHPGTPSTEKSMSVSIKDQRKAIKALLYWVQQRTRKYGVAVQDFASSWRSGLAFLAVIKAIDSSLVDMKKALEKSPRENLEDAFSIAQQSLRIPRLLEPEDLMVDFPDEHSIMTYVTQFLEHFPELNSDDFTNQTEEAPLEITYVHYKDGPTEEEGTIFTVNKDEDKDYSMEFETRPLTPPETHDYAAVDIPYDSKPISEARVKNPFQVSAEMKRGPVLHTAAGFKSNHVSRQLQMSPTRSSLSVKSPDRPGTSENREDRNGEAAIHHTDSMEDNRPNSTFVGPKGPQYMLSHIHNSSNSSSSFSSISDKEPSDQKQKYQADNGTAQPTLKANHNDPLPSYKVSEEDDAFKYVLHSPKDSSRGDHKKQMTVFQAYKASTEDQPDHKSHHLTSNVDSGLEETDETDSTSPPKISVIPHDLFYYPHYSVPIADVLQAFADTSPDSSIKKTRAFDDTSEGFTDDTDSFSGHYLDTETAENGISEAESPLTVGLDGSAWDLRFEKTSSPECPVGLLSNGSIPQPIHDLQNSNVSFDPGYSKPYQGVGRNESPKKSLEEKATSRKGLINKKAEIEDEGLLESDKAANLTAEIQERKLKDLRFSRDIQSDPHVYKRRELNICEQLNSGALQSTSEDGDQPSQLRKEGDGNTAPLERMADGSRLSFLNKQLPDMYYMVVLLWLLCYCFLILPELDMSKVKFLAYNN